MQLIMPLMYSMSKPAKTAPFSMRFDPELKARLQAIADKERRSLTNLIEAKLWEVAESHSSRPRRDDAR